MRSSRLLPASALLATALLSAACAGRRAGPAPLGDRQTRLERAYEHLRREQWHEAVGLLGTVIDEDPENERLRMERGYALFALGDMVAARDEFSAVAARGGGFAEQAARAVETVDAESTDEARAARRDAILNRGYAALERGRKTEARGLFVAALEQDPTRVEVHKQLGYMSIGEGDMRAAAASLERAQRLQPRDHMTALELGYVYAGMNRRRGAEKNFRYALGSPDPEVRRKAEEGLVSIRAGAECPYVDVFATPYAESRFGNRIMMAEAMLGCRPLPRLPVSGYLVGRLQRDSRTAGGQTPEIYNDNVLSFGPGLRVQPRGLNTSLQLEWNWDTNVTRSPEHPRRSEGNGRAVLTDYGYWEGLLGARRLFSDLGASLGWYGRYRDNVIAYGQARAGAKLWERFPARLNLYLPLNASVDTNKDFFNNIVETGAGAELQFLGGLNLRLRLEALRGWYTGREGRDPNPYGRRYHDLRVTLIYFAHLARPPERDPAWDDDPRPGRRRSFRW